MFYHLCYEGSVDLDNVANLTARHALEVQISEFGQIPKQLFDKPHVPKICIGSESMAGWRLTHGLNQSASSSSTAKQSMLNDDKTTNCYCILDCSIARNPV